MVFHMPARWQCTTGMVALASLTEALSRDRESTLRFDSFFIHNNSCLKINIQQWVTSQKCFCFLSILWKMWDLESFFPWHHRISCFNPYINDDVNDYDDNDDGSGDDDNDGDDDEMIMMMMIIIIMIMIIILKIFFKIKLHIFISLHMTFKAHFRSTGASYHDQFPFKNG